MKERAPAFQFFPRQFAGDDQVMGMDLEAIGAHILLMCTAASSPEGCRIDADEYAIRMRLRNPSDEVWAGIKRQLLAGAWKVSEHGKWWIQDGLQRTFQKQKEFTEQQSARARARWGQSSAESMPISYRANAGKMQASMPKVCSSSSRKSIVSEACGSDAESAKKKNPSPTTEAGLRLAETLRVHLLRNNPTARVTEAKLAKWAVEADRMIRLDGRTAKQIADLIEFSQQDEFWFANILSMGKLREKFDQLTNQRRRKQQRPAEADCDESADNRPATPKWPGLADDRGQEGVEN